MKIQGHEPIDRVHGTSGKESTGPARPVQPGPAVAPGRTDQLEISAAGSEFHRIREAARRSPEIRAELVASLRSRIESGEYEPDAAAIARGILEELREPGPV